MVLCLKVFARRQLPAVLQHTAVHPAFTRTDLLTLPSSIDDQRERMEVSRRMRWKVFEMPVTMPRLQHTCTLV